MATELYIDASDPSLQGLYRSANGTLSALTPAIVRNDVLPRRIHVMEENPVATALGKLRHRVIAGAALEVAIAIPDLGPAAGTFLLSSSADSTGLTVLSYAITAAALETAFNANPAIIAEGSVDVTGTAPVFISTWRTFGAKALLASSAAALEPASTIDIDRTDTGDGDTHEVQVIRLLRRPFAYSSNWSVTSDPSTAAATLSPTGSATTKGVVDLTIPETAESGSFRLEFARAQVWKITGGAPNNAVAERFYLEVGTPTAAGDYNNVLWDVEDNAGPVRMWMNYNGTGTAPTAPTGGRNLVIAYNTGTAQGIRDAIKTALAADAQFAGTQSTTLVKLLVVNTTGGTRQSPPPTVTGASAGAILTFTIERVGTNGNIAGKYLPMADNGGNLAVWFDVHNDTEPAHGAARSIRVPASGLTTAALTNTAIQTALDADSEFTAAIVGTQINVTDVNTGTRSIGSLGNTSLLSVQVTTAGVGMSDELAFDVTTADLEASFGDFWHVTATKPRQFRLVSKANGTWAAPTVTSNFVVPTYFDGTINLNGTNLHAAFALLGADSDSIDGAFLSAKYTTPSGAKETILRMAVPIYRSVLDEATLEGDVLETALGAGSVGNFLSGVTGYTGGGATNLDGITTVGVSVPRLYAFVHATDGLRFYRLKSATTAEASPGIIRPDDYAASTNEKVWESVG